MIKIIVELTLVPSERNCFVMFLPATILPSKSEIWIYR